MTNLAVNIDMLRSDSICAHCGLEITNSHDIAGKDRGRYYCGRCGGLFMYTNRILFHWKAHRGQFHHGHYETKPIEIPRLRPFDFPQSAIL